MRAVEIALVLVVFHQTSDLHRTTVILQHRDTTQTLLGAAVRHANLNVFTDTTDSHDAVGRGPIGCTLVDERVDEDALDITPVLAVDPDVLAVGALSATVIPIEFEVWGRAIVAPCVTQRLNDADATILHFVKAAEIEVDAVVTPEQLGEKSLVLGRIMVPVQVENHIGRSSLVEIDALGQADAFAAFRKINHLNPFQ